MSSHSPLPSVHWPLLRLIGEGDWSPQLSARLYRVEAWGKGFFQVGDDGNVHVCPRRDRGGRINLREIVEGLIERGIDTPLLINFTDLLEQRLADMQQAFDRAIAENDYGGRYCAVFPIKVNQQRYMVEQIERCGRDRGYGLEVGSKPELLAVMARTSQTPDRLIICNGFKEERYIRHILLATKLGRHVVAVVENLNELDLLLRQAESSGVSPCIGVRVNLSQSGSGRWSKSSGDLSKFGLTIPGLMQMVERLRECGRLDCLQLLHCHMGSQLNDVRVIHRGVNELTRIYVELVKEGVGLRYLDVGGGLGIDYDGSQTRSDFSTNYTLDEYASTVVHRIGSVCDEASVRHPTLITEAGRAMVSHQSVLVFNVLGANQIDRFGFPEHLAEPPSGGSIPRVLEDLLYVYRNIEPKRILECYHDANLARDEAITLFNVGHLSLADRGLVDRVYWSICLRVVEQAGLMDPVPRELSDLSRRLCDTYFCNVSVFQSLPDAWAIDQVFPILPIHRLDETPLRRAKLADITCDSDGVLDRFVTEDGLDTALPVHTLREDEPYFLGAFLVGAYQETLGDLHNLFGDANVVHVRMDGEGRWHIDEWIQGDSVREVLGYLQYDTKNLYNQIRRDCERCVREGLMDVAESRQILKEYDEGLSGYTYLE
ncbi:MAG: biosynthetic arginine decarboxylase [Phycisphaeraceae bacterium]|nr:biosynthetic arginine decarboxylase [Phycisphaeraceae bacterium]